MTKKGKVYMNMCVDTSGDQTTAIKIDKSFRYYSYMCYLFIFSMKDSLILKLEMGFLTKQLNATLLAFTIGLKHQARGIT